MEYKSSKRDGESKRHNLIESLVRKGKRIRECFKRRKCKITILVNPTSYSDQIKRQKQPYKNTNHHRRHVLGQCSITVYDEDLPEPFILNYTGSSFHDCE
ncbi:MAG: hypothetical protein MHMPM18_001997 [Marteilia pararefringens]